jgi:CMP-N-acetylneuraminic acid synthetase
MKNPKVLCVIPARKGSQGIKNKNMKKLNGKPLLQWTIESALKSKLISKIVFSTDSEKMIKFVKKKYSGDIETPFRRPSRLSANNSPLKDTLIHTINFYKKNNFFFDYLVLLEPTSPIRFKDDIDNGIIKFHKKNKNFDGLISVGATKINPFLLKTLEKDKAKNIFKIKPKNLNRQNFKKVYFPFGVLYLSKIKSFLRHESFYTNKTMFYKIKDCQCYEIDDIYDFFCVEKIMKKVKFK